MNLYYITYTNSDGMCLDTPFQANTPEEAANLWLEIVKTYDPEIFEGQAFQSEGEPEHSAAVVFQIMPDHTAEPTNLKWTWSEDNTGPRAQKVGHINERERT